MDSRVVWTLLLVACAAAPAAGDGWSYHGTNGPNYWSNSYPPCTMHAQSPVDIVTSKVVDGSDLGLIQFAGYNAAPASDFTLVNNGHTLKLNLVGDIVISGSGLPGIFKAAQLHFHWGENNLKGSEHTVDGLKYPAEMHIVHYNTKYEDLSLAADKDDGLAVLGVFLQAGGSTHEGMEKMLGKTGSVIYRDQKAAVAPFALNTLLPSDTETFYRYSGSLTTPPCYESVTWTVFSTPVQVSNQQLEALRKMKENEQGKADVIMIDNFRPVQPHETRKIKLSKGAPATPPGGVDNYSNNSGATVAPTLAWLSTLTLIAATVITRLG